MSYSHRNLDTVEPVIYPGSIGFLLSNDDGRNNILSYLILHHTGFSGAQRKNILVFYMSCLL